MSWKEDPWASHPCIFWQSSLKQGARGVWMCTCLCVSLWKHCPLWRTHDGHAFISLHGAQLTLSQSYRISVEQKVDKMLKICTNVHANNSMMKNRVLPLVLYGCLWCWWFSWEIPLGLQGPRGTITRKHLLYNQRLWMNERLRKRYI